jgi:hypothetical protein
MYLVRLAPFSKVPVLGPLQISDDPAVHAEWLRNGNNVGLRLEENEMVAADYDTIPGARNAWVRLVQSGLCNLVNKTRRGAHFLFSGRSPTTAEEELDRKGNGHVVWPPSVVRHKDGTKWQYRFVLGDENTKPLPFPEYLFPKAGRKELSTNIEVQANVDRLTLISRAMMYANTMDLSVPHSSIDNALFRLACHMVRNPPNGFGLTIEEAWPIALMFNQRCATPSEDRVIRRKLLEAKKKG